MDTSHPTPASNAHQRIAALLPAYRADAGDSNEREILEDLLTDLRHWAAVERARMIADDADPEDPETVDFTAALSASEGHWAAETDA